jgi:hypothetical protein
MCCLLDGDSNAFVIAVVGSTECLCSKVEKTVFQLILNAVFELNADQILSYAMVI